MVASKGAKHTSVALATLIAAVTAAAATAGAAAQVPCSVAKQVAPGEVRRFHFQRAGTSEDLLCVFTFQTQLGASLTLSLDFVSFDNMTESDCECGALSMYDVSSSGELLLNVRRCAGEEAEGAVLQASASVVLLTLATRACAAPAFALSVGTPDALDVSPGDAGGHSTITTTTTTTTTTAATNRPTPSPPTSAPRLVTTAEATPSTPALPAPTRPSVLQPATPSTTTVRPTVRSRPLYTPTTTTSTSDSMTTTKRNKPWWSG